MSARSRPLGGDNPNIFGEPRGDGSCKATQNGRHEGKWRVQTVVSSDLGNKRRLSQLFDLQKAAKEFRPSLIHDDDKARVVAKKELILSVWFDC